MLRAPYLHSLLCNCDVIIYFIDETLNYSCWSFAFFFGLWSAANHVYPLNCLCLCLIDTFFAIISDAYSEVKSDIANQNKFEMDGYFKRVSEKEKSKKGFH